MGFGRVAFAARLFKTNIHETINNMTEYELREIFNKNLKEFNGVLRLDAIIIKAMQEAIEVAEKKKQKQKQLRCGPNIKSCAFYRNGGVCGNLDYCIDQI